MQFSTYVFLGSTLLAAGMVAAQASNGLTVSTLPLITTCANNRLTWVGGTAPFLVTIITPGQATATLQNLGSVNMNYVLYSPDGTTTGIQPGDQVAVYVRDNMGFDSASAQIPVVAGPCTSGGSSSSAAASSSSSAASSSSSSAAAPTTPVSSSTTTMTTSTSKTSTATTSTSASATPSKTGAAAPGLNGLTAVVAGAVGVVAAALI